MLPPFRALYLIEILHQTTTYHAWLFELSRLYLIEILHQTTTTPLCQAVLRRCILSKFYIKPQQKIAAICPEQGCILSKFYIKPQLPVPFRGYQHVVSYRNSTSNHNSKTEEYPYPALYLIEILHQTTTLRLTICLVVGCILSKFYIKPQQDAKRQTAGNGCILSKFYIKPQRSARTALRSAVVSYRNSTSNHNGRPCMAFTIRVVSYRNSTSNHNWDGCIYFVYIVVSYRNSTSNHNYLLQTRSTAFVVSYRNSTSNHNLEEKYDYLRQVVSYRNSTSNHNSFKHAFFQELLYLIEILHQTTTRARPLLIPLCCILSKFYIKPQLRLERELARCSCILSKFYIKPQQRIRHKIGHSVVSYRNSTSNHNIRLLKLTLSKLYLIEILHQTTTRGR